MKRVLSLVVAVVLTFSVLNVTWVYAIEPYEMQPNYIGVATMKPGLTLNTGGLMTCTDNIEIKTGYTAKVVWSLQYQSNRNWISTANCKCKLDTCTVELSESERRSGWKPQASVLGDAAAAFGCVNRVEELVKQFLRGAVTKLLARSSVQFISCRQDVL